ncbi:putative ribose/galactose/methyl galactoside import ATP-binding protein 1 [Asanoa ishikariensis]|uniref:Ribose transport system ATP-binding protein n=1 Tax=Asanoa ishikariensis TaxID=137265 RepID=A0A1H3UC54_9ACTN|nr:sugar ABC transporter ATP-binding protein [Asanoa ishikariensis]GIF63867.1 putative ribose/galactose/methyl galactoside import ATP-binding protein 1 [Asanoa ishikariensis]SDZ60020.1 ribose transport system ATP-binding protein [Asanoa ishikariensis]
MSSDPGGTPPILDVRDVHKVYRTGTHALRGVSMRVRPGTVHGLIGANGAGKSTLIKILSGAQTVSDGEIAWRGEPAHWSSPSQALADGLAAVYQHMPLVPSLSVLDNVFLGHTGSVRWDRTRRTRELAELCDRVGYPLDGDDLVGDLSIGARQMVAILQALARGPALVLLDEPTAALSPSEREILFASVRRLRDTGTTFIYVSHFLDEVLDLTDHLTVLRDGLVVLDAPTASTDEAALITAIVGERLAAFEADAPSPARDLGEVVLAVDDLASGAAFGPLSFSVRAGEVVGIAGLLGSGRTELLQAIYGADRAVTGSVTVNGRDRPRGPQVAVRRGMALVPEDRARQGFLADWEIWRNISLPDLPRLSWRRMFPHTGRERAQARQAVEDLGIKTQTIDSKVGDLSGGNAQKVVFAKWLYGNASIFLLDEPTAGVDVGAKSDILHLIRRLAQRGAAVLIVTSEFEELIGSCDRILVLRRGALVADLVSAETDVHEVTAIASGFARHGDQISSRKAATS